MTANNYLPTIFSGYRGVIGMKGRATAAIHIPADNRLIGLRIHTAFVTVSPSAPFGLKSISNTFSFTICGALPGGRTDRAASGPSVRSGAIPPAPA